MINYEVLQIGYAVDRDGDRYPAELVFDYDLAGGAKKGLKVKRHIKGGRYDNGWWYYDLKDFTFTPNETLNKLIGV